MCLALPKILSFCLLALLATGTALSAKRFNIIVNAEADEAYMERAEGLEYQTYHILKGKYHGGSTRDPGLEGALFEDLLGSLVETLKKRDMYPEPDRNKGDLLIMVSWGRTSLDPDWGELMGVTDYDFLSSESGGDEAEGSAVEDLSSGGEFMGTESTSSRVQNMALLGLQGRLRGPNPLGFSPDQDLWDVLEEERYFVVLNAFDYQFLLEEKELKQVWRVRYNTRAVGVGFRTAFESMNDAVVGVIGLQMDDIAKVKGDTKGRVSMGEVEVLEMGEPEEKKARK